MDIILTLSRGCIIFVAASGFLFGQLFFGRFEVLATTIGVSGIAAALLGLAKTKLKKNRALIILALSAISLIGIGLDATEYYRTHSTNSGSYYPWILVDPYCISLFLITGHAIKNIYKSVNS